MNIKSPEIIDIPALKVLWKEAFGDGDEFLNSFFQSAYSETRALIAEEKGEVLGVLYWFNCELRDEKIAYVYAVATAEKHRGKGVCHRIMEYAHKHLRDNGYKGVVLVPGEKSLFDFYEDMGYKVCSYIKEIECGSGGFSADIKEIDKERYAMLRRKYLPCNGVVQEGENIDFLDAQMNLYEGDGYVLAGRKTGDAFYGAEILGDMSHIKEIVKVMDCNKGIFRTVGEGRPFAMWYALSDITAPQYFGLAFD